MREFYFTTDRSESGLLFLISGGNHLEDGIDWVDQKKMSVKLILHDEARNIFKVKNAKTDEGAVIMRRRTWFTDDAGWRRHEYKIYHEQVFYRQAQPGGPTVMETRSVLADFPVVVHYFKKKSDIAVLPRARKKQKRSETDEDGGTFSDDESSPLTMLRNVLRQPVLSHPAPLGVGRGPAPFGAAALGLRFNVFHPAAPLRFGVPSVHAEDDDPMDTSGPGNDAQPDLGLHPSNLMDTVPNDMFILEHANGTNHFSADTPPHLGVFSPDSNCAFFGHSLSFCRFLRCLMVCVVDSMDLYRAGSPALNLSGSFDRATSSSSSSPYAWGIKIRSFAPDIAYSMDSTRILFFVEPTTDSAANMLKHASDPGRHEFQPQSVQFIASFDGIEVEARVLSQNVVEVLTPPKQPGLTSVWLCSRNMSPGNSPYTHSGHVFNSPSSPQQSGAIPVSSPIQFFFVPSDENGHLSLAYQLTPHLRSHEVMQRFRHSCRSLDLSYNSLDDVQFLSNFYHLKILV